ncbi:MAG: c-type cytochrome [Acidobacteriota bacterium]|nr:c-type cytochrome [Acidobacteriota bacterium]
MSKKRIIYCKSTIVLGFIFIFLAASWKGKIAHSQAVSDDKPVEQVRKNIQVLKGIPDSQLLPVMHQMRTALGVRCDYCHIAENDSYWKDDKSEKQTARQMIQMTFDINKANFNGKPVVTCNTCHRGQIEPVPVPAIGQGAFANTTKAEADAKPAEPLPSAEQIFDKYIQAIGGKAAIENIKTRHAKVLLLRPKLVNSGTPKAAIINRGETWTIETYQKFPDKYLSVITSPQGIVSQGYNGASGWVKTAQGQWREMNAAEIERVKREADLYADLKLKEQYSSMTLTGKEKIGERETFVIEAVRVKDKKPEKLYFDTQDGLLLRRTLFTETVLGLNPEQTDFEDYRAVGGVKMPFTVRVSYLDDNHYGTTRNFVEVKNNISLSDDKFDPSDKQKK